MASYLVLVPPGARYDDEKVRFIADGFAWVAFLFPGLWLLAKRQWLAGIAIVAAQIAIAVVTSDVSAMLAGVLIELALRLLVALEGSAFLARRLQSAGWTLQSIIVADNLAAAEEIYDLEAAALNNSADNWQQPVLQAIATGQKPRFSVFEEYYGER